MKPQKHIKYSFKPFGLILSALWVAALLCAGAVIRPSAAVLKEFTSIDGSEHIQFENKDNHPSPIQLPDDTQPLGEDDQSEKENKDEKDGKEYDHHLAYQLSKDLNSQLSSTAVKQLEQAFANRGNIPLFIQHHSWKSFLV